jgi:hypothetical protein
MAKKKAIDAEREADRALAEENAARLLALAQKAQAKLDAERAGKD